MRPLRRLVVHNFGSFCRIRRHWPLAVGGSGRALVRSGLRVGTTRWAHLTRSKSLIGERGDLGLPLLLGPDAIQDLVGHSHGHAAKVWNQVHTLSVSSKTT